MQSRNELLYKLETSINKLRKFCCPDFDEINSREYYKEIIEKMCPETHNSYSYIFGDFDKLQSINQNYGFNMGNKALSNAMDIIKSALPDDAIISRLGGDEFSIILPNKDDKKSKFYIQQIHNALQKNANSIYGLTITLASASSNLGSIHELYNIAEKDVSKQKNRALNSNINNENFLPFNIKKEKMSDSELSSWEHLNTSIDSATYNFLKNIRASESFDFKPSEPRNTATSMLNALNDLINKNIDNPNLDVGNNYENENLSEYSKQIVTNPKVALLIHKLVKDENVNIDSLSDEALQDLLITMRTLLNELIKDASSNLLSEPYFRLYLADKISVLNKPIQGVYFTSSGIKLSNTAYSHKHTDQRLKLTSKNLINAFSKIRDYNNYPFSNSINNTYLLSQGGGNFLALIPQENAITKEELDNILNEVNSFVDMNNPCSPFLMAGASFDNMKKISTQKLLSEVEKLKKEANLKKDPLKKKLFYSSDFEICFKKSFDSCITEYLDNITDAQNIKNKTLFINTLFNSLLNHCVYHNETFQSNEKNNKNEMEL